MTTYKKSATLVGPFAALFVFVVAANLPAQTNVPSSVGSSTTTSGVTSTTTEQKKSDEVVQLSAFEVTTTQGRGYVSTNAASGFKTNELLLNIPQVDTVITRDLINDIGYHESSDVTQYFGLNNFYRGEAFAMRGYRINYAYVDEMPSNQPFEDNTYVDTYELIRGPAQVLYMNASLSGAVLKSTKKPLPFKQDVVTASIDSFGTYRATADSTAPLAFGDSSGVKLGYRVVAAAQGGSSYFDNVTNRSKLFHPVFQATFANTTIRFYWDWQDMLRPPNGNSLVTPSGDLYTGAGRRNANIPQNAMEHHQSNRFFIGIFQRISDNWENQTKLGQWNLHRFNPVVFTASVDWGAQTETLNARLDNIHYAYWALIDDLQGHYSIGPFKNIDAIGGGWQEYTVRQWFWSATTVGFSNPTVKLSDAATINAITLPPASVFTYNLFPTQRPRTRTTVYESYWQHTIDVVPNWVKLVTGWTWAGVNTESITNISAVPWTATVTPAQRWLHRYGVVVTPTKEISVYAMEATSFNPPTQGAVLENGGLPPPQLGKSNELGIKTLLLDGRFSANVAWFKMTTTNVLQLGFISPTGFGYAKPIGSSLQEGVDGDFAMSILPGWQVVGSFYAGHDRDQDGKPVPNSYDNAWSLMNRYDFAKESPFKGWGIGAGVVRVGGRWVARSGITNAPWTDFQNWSNEIKLKTGTLVNVFVSKQVNKHLSVRASCANLLDKAYILGDASALLADPSVPRSITLDCEYKF